MPPDTQPSTARSDPTWLCASLWGDCRAGPPPFPSAACGLLRRSDSQGKRPGTVRIGRCGLPLSNRGPTRLTIRPNPTGRIPGKPAPGSRPTMSESPVGLSFPWQAAICWLQADCDCEGEGLRLVHCRHISGLLRMQHHPNVTIALHMCFDCTTLTTAAETTPIGCHDGSIQQHASVGR